MTTALVHSDAYRRFDYGPAHPLRMERLDLTYALMAAYGLTTRPGIRLVAPTVASEAAIRDFHTAEYLAVLRAADAGHDVPGAARHGLGPGDNPIWPGCYEASALACGGSILCSRASRYGRFPRRCPAATGAPGERSGSLPFPAKETDDDFPRGNAAHAECGR